MTKEEMQVRYERARLVAGAAIEDLDMVGSDPAAVYQAVETAVLWKVMLALGGHVPIDMDVMADMFDATDAGGT